MNKELIKQLASDLLEAFCAEGMRSAGGTYTRFSDDESAQRRTEAFLKRWFDEHKQ